MNRARLLSSALRAALAAAALLVGRPDLLVSSVEIAPLIAVVPAARCIVLGTVSSLETRVVPGAETPEPAVANIAVERWIAGEVPPETFPMAFMQGSGGSADGPMLLAPYERGRRLLLIITSERDGMYEAPVVPPRILQLGAGFAPALATVEFVEYISATGSAPVSVRAEKTEGAADAALTHLTLHVSNHLSTPLQVVSAPAEPPAPVSDAVVVWFRVHHRVGGETWDVAGRFDDPSRTLTVPEGASLQATFDFLGGPDLIGRRATSHLYVTVSLPTSEGKTYLDTWTAFDLRTAVARDTWGQIKAARCPTRRGAQ